MSATAINSYALADFVIPAPITSDSQNERYLAVLMELETKDHLTHEERNFAELLTLMIEDYEEKQYQIPEATPIEVLTELMSANDLKQKDLVDVFGTESIVSAVLHGKRLLNMKYVEKLSERFNVSPALFFERRARA
jgi:HTH-type transcriptional regulator / antitoxin HigA